MGLFKKSFAIFLLMIFFLSVIIVNPAILPAQAETVAAGNNAGSGIISSKEEVIYATLGANGAVQEIYAVNILNVDSAGLLKDYGTYSSMKNLTTLDEITSQGDEVTITAPVGRFYYQGNMTEHSLPWDISVSYYLDGSQIDPETLAGKNGYLEINIVTKQNSGVDPSFFEHYLLQAAITLDTGLCSNIHAGGATAANAGTGKLLTFTVLPGNDGNITISSDVTDFKMEGITFSAVPLSMNIEKPDTSEFTDDLKLLSEAIGQLSDGISSAQEGAELLKNGADDLKDGSSEFATGLGQIDSRSEELLQASEKIQAALENISGMLNDNDASDSMTKLGELPASLTTLASGLSEISDGLTLLKSSFHEAYQALDASMATISDSVIPEADFQALLAKNPDDPALAQLIDVYKAAQTVKGTYSMVKPAFAAADSNLSTMDSSLAAITQTLNLISDQLSETFENTDIASSITQLSSGISMLSDNYKSFHEGLTGYTGGIAQLTSAYRELDTGITDVADGTGNLSSGLKEFNEGMKELKQQTGTIPDQMETAVDDLLSGYDNSDFTPVSFVSAKNGTVASVQFVIKTEEINEIKVEEPEVVQNRKENFWTRLKDLFQ